MKLYEIASEYRNVLRDIEDGADTNEELEQIVEKINAIESDFEVKAQNVAMYFLEIESDIKAIKEEEDRLTARRKSLQTRSDWLKEYLKENMVKTGKVKIKTPLLTLSVQNNRPAVQIINDEELPKEFKIEEVIYTPNKTAIRIAINAGYEVAGATLTQGTRLVIK